MLAHQLGFPLTNEVTSGMWNWEKMWKECGAGQIGSDDGDAAASLGKRRLSK
jgi:hypothetical protein